MKSYRSGNHRYAFSFSIFFLLTFSGCKKDVTANLEQNKSRVPAVKSFYSIFNFDWEAATYMPSLSNANLVQQE